MRAANAYVEEATHWALAKHAGERRRLEVVLYMLADALRILALLVFPALPVAAQELWSRLGFDDALGGRSFSELEWGGLPAGAPIVVGDPLFPRVDETAPSA
ncbi:hypothetical protein BH18ACT15_BH18ACT15_14530 [soil metagenome]